jgi:hypothetical protein
MGCGCSKNAGRVTRTQSATTPRIVQNTPRPSSQIVSPSNLTPRASQSVSGLNVNRNAVNQIRQDAIKRALGK